MEVRQGRWSMSADSKGPKWNRIGNSDYIKV